MHIRSRFFRSAFQLKKTSFALIFSLLTAGSASAQLTNEYEVDPFVDWQKQVEDLERLSALGDDMFGDAIDHNSGSVTFSHTDLSIPGNFDLEVSVKRRLSRGVLHHHSVQADFGDWELVVPRITAQTAEDTNFRTGNRCSAVDAFQTLSVK